MEIVIDLLVNEAETPAGTAARAVAPAYLRLEITMGEMAAGTEIETTTDTEEAIPAAGEVAPDVTATYGAKLMTAGILRILVAVAAAVVIGATITIATQTTDRCKGKKYHPLEVDGVNRTQGKE